MLPAPPVTPQSLWEPRPQGPALPEGGWEARGEVLVTALPGDTCGRWQHQAALI